MFSFELCVVGSLGRPDLFHVFYGKGGPFLSREVRRFGMSASIFG